MEKKTRASQTAGTLGLEKIEEKRMKKEMSLRKVKAVVGKLRWTFSLTLKPWKNRRRSFKSQD
eukprot:12913510-Prorocentrum_lima.AAC.1